MEIERRHSDAIARNLRDFGYPVTNDYVWEKVTALIRGEEPTEIIGMMAQSQLKNAGLI